MSGLLFPAMRVDEESSAQSGFSKRKPMTWRAMLKTDRDITQDSGLYLSYLYPHY